MVLSSEEIQRRRSNPKEDRTRYIGCGSIRELKAEDKTLISTHALHIYTAESENATDVAYLTNSALRTVSKAKCHSKTEESLTFTQAVMNSMTSKLKLALKTIPNYYSVVEQQNMADVITVRSKN